MTGEDIHAFGAPTAAPVAPGAGRGTTAPGAPRRRIWPWLLLGLAVLVVLPVVLMLALLAVALAVGLALLSVVGTVMLAVCAALLVLALVVTLVLAPVWGSLLLLWLLLRKPRSGSAFQPRTAPV